jgi:asparagine synthase (glutamine-hydrolysing)
LLRPYVEDPSCAANEPMPFGLQERGGLSMMRYFDMQTYLPGDILVKVDRASMSTALEARCPLLDYRVLAFSFLLPENQLVREGRGKFLLRSLLSRYLPQELWDRPKQGFAIPVNSWLRTELRDWAEALLEEDKLKDTGFEQPEAIRKLWRAHQEKRFGGGSFFWNLLMLQAWMQSTER